MFNSIKYYVKNVMVGNQASKHSIDSNNFCQGQSGTSKGLKLQFSF